MSTHGVERRRLQVVSFALEAEQVKRLAALAAQEDRSRSYLVRRALARELDLRERTGREAT